MQLLSILVMHLVAPYCTCVLKISCRVDLTGETKATIAPGMPILTLLKRIKNKINNYI